MPESHISTETYTTIDQIVRIGNTAVAKAQEESRRLGIPNVYSINGHIYYELPNGELSTSDPYENGTQSTEQSVEREPE